jgi:DNA-binding NtrC family response regulator
MGASEIFILDDDPEFRGKVRDGLGGLYGLTEAQNEQEFHKLWIPRHFDLLLLDMRLRRDKEGLDVLRQVFAQDEHQPVIMVSAYGDTETAIEAVGAGAMMFLHKREFTPAMLGRMAEAVIEQGRLRRQVRALRQMAWADDPENLLGNSAAIREAVSGLREASADSESIPVIIGERGTGTSLAARIMHRHSERAEGPLFETDGDALRKLEAFFRDRHSPWLQAEGGTLVLDHVERVEHRSGRALMEQLRTQNLTERTPQLVFLMHQSMSSGRNDSASTMPWLDSATPYTQIRLPPLRERKEDIPLLASYFLQVQRAKGHTPARSFNAKTMEVFESHEWPGNIRELRNNVEYAAMQAAVAESMEIGIEHLPTEMSRTGNTPASRVSRIYWDYRLHLARAELELAERAIQEHRIGRKTELVKVLGYTDRFMLGRRIRKALADFPALSGEYKSVTRLFRESRTT